MKVALHGFTATPAMWTEVGVEGYAILGHDPKVQAEGHETFDSEGLRLVTLRPDSPVHLVGYSLGARLSLALAIAHPARVRALSLIGVNPGIEDNTGRTERVASDVAWSKMLRTKGLATFVDAWESLALWKSQANLPQERRAALRRERMSHDPEQLARAMDTLGTGSMPPMWDALPTLKMPVQVIAGALDTKYVAIGARMCKLLPNASQHLIIGSGHNPIFEDPQSVRNVLNEIS